MPKPAKRKGVESLGVKLTQAKEKRLKSLLKSDDLSEAELKEAEELMLAKLGQQSDDKGKSKYGSGRTFPEDCPLEPHADTHPENTDAYRLFAYSR